MRMRAPVATAIAIAIGLIILAGYFIPDTNLQNIRNVFLSWGATLGGIAMLVGIANLVAVHWRKLSDPRRKDYYSAITILAFIVTAGAGLVLWQKDPTSYQHVITNIQEPVEISLLAILSVTLAYACLRLVQRRGSAMTIVFIASTLLFLFLSSGLLPSAQPDTFLGGVLGFFNRLPQAGMRGILLGVALGSLTTGLRIILGSDRPYSG